jgi:hypothetical protein
MHIIVDRFSYNYLFVIPPVDDEVVFLGEDHPATFSCFFPAINQIVGFLRTRENFATYRCIMVANVSVY